MFNENALIKKPHQKESWTKEQYLEFAKCADPLGGALYFMENYFKIQHPTEGQLQYKPYDFQKELIDTYLNYRFSINLLSRQTGKCCLYNSAIYFNTKQNKDQVKWLNENISPKYFTKHDDYVIMDTQYFIGDLLWKDLTTKQKIITKLEQWLVKLAK